MKSVVLFFCLAVTAQAQVWSVRPSWTVVHSATPAQVASNWRATVAGSLTNHMTRDPAQSASMRPYIQPGDLMLWEPRFGPLKGRVLLISNGPKKLPTAHYCYDENKTHVFMVGLNNRVSDGWIDKDRATHALVTVVKGP